LSSCGTLQLIGGQGIFSTNTVATKILGGLPSHYKFEMDFELVAIDSLKGNTFGIYFDNLLVGSFPIIMSPINYNSVKFKSLSLNNGDSKNGYFSFANLINMDIY